MEFKYILEEGSKKYNCPQCDNKTYVRYIDVVTGDYLAYRFGRCDRETNCKYFVKPDGEISNTYEIKYTPPKPISYHSHDLVAKSTKGFKKNNIIQFLKSIFQIQQVQDVIVKYNIGTSKYWDGATLYWQMDDYGKIRHGKVMLHDRETGKRQKDKKGKPCISSIKTILKLKDFNLNQCLFGLHLVNDVNTKIAVVESEKTAIIMSIVKPEYTWVATGGKQGFKYNMLMPIKANKIVAFPDKGEYNFWLNKAIELNELGFKINVSEGLEKTNYKVGTDLADVFLETIKSTPNENYCQDKKEDLAPIIEIPTIPIISEAESKLILLAAKNPSVLSLIPLFDLTDENGLDINIDLIEKQVQNPPSK